MKLLLTTIAAAVLVGCGPSVDIHEAAAFGNIEAIKQHLAADADVNAKDRMGWTPLCEAAINGHKEIAELLIANGADVNAKDDRGMTPLDWAIKQILQTHHSPAVQQKHTEIAELLITTGADVNVKGNDGTTPLDTAVHFNNTKIADLLRKHGGKTGEELKAEGK